MKRIIRKLDNTAKYFSLEDKKYNNVFRLSILLKENVNPKCLRKAISMVPLFIKKIYMKYMARTYSGSATTTLSNIGVIKLLDKYQNYIDNVLVLINPGRYQKVKCTVCSYDNNLNVTINSSLVSNKLEEEFYRLLTRYIGDVKLLSNN